MQTLHGAGVAFSAPQELPPALHCVPKPRVFLSNSPRALHVFFSGVLPSPASGFPCNPEPSTCMRVCSPEPFRCLLGYLSPLSMFTVPQSSPFAFPCTPEPSLSLPAPPRSLRVFQWAQSLPSASPCSPGLSMGFSESPRLYFWAPQEPPRDFSRALQPSTCLSLRPSSLYPVFRASPGDPALPLISQGQAARREGRAVGWDSQANMLIGDKGSRQASAWPTGEEGSPPSTCVQGQERKRRFDGLSFVHNPDEKESCKAEGREQRGEERRRHHCITTNLTWEAASSNSGGVEGWEAGARVSHSPATSLDAAGWLPPCGKRHEAASSTFLKVLTCGHITSSHKITLLCQYSAA